MYSVCTHVPLQIFLLSHFIYQPVDKSESPQLAYGPDSIRPALAPNEVHYLCREYKDNMKLSKDEIRRIEKDTRDQVIQALPQMFLLSSMQAENIDTSCQLSKKTCYTIRHPLMYLHCVGVGRMRIMQERPTLRK